MANNEMYLLLKLISQKPKKLKTILAISTVLVFLGVLLSFQLVNSCEVEHVSILSEVQTYEKSFDPESCERTVYKILDYNEKCEPDIEILDCS